MPALDDMAEAKRDEVPLQEPFATRAEWADGWARWHDASDPLPTQWDDETKPPDLVTHVYTADQLRQCVLAERERCAKLVEKKAANKRRIAAESAPPPSASTSKPPPPPCRRWPRLFRPCAVDESTQPSNATCRVELCPLRRRQADGALHQPFGIWLRWAATLVLCFFHAGSIGDAKRTCKRHVCVIQ